MHQCASPNTLMPTLVPCQVAHGTQGLSCLAQANHAPPHLLACLLQQHLVSCLSLLSRNNESWHFIHGLIVPMHRALRPCAMYSHSFKLVTFVVAPLCHSIGAMASQSVSVHKIECLGASNNEGYAAPCPMPLRPQVAHHTCCRAHLCVLACRPHVMVMPKVMPQCPFGVAKTLP